MGALDIDLSEFDDPNPQNLARQPADGKGKPENERPVTKRKLPYRANVTLKGRKYKGKRVSRADAELDRETLGVFDDDQDLSGADDDSSDGGIDDGGLASDSDESVPVSDRKGRSAVDDDEDDFSDLDLEDGEAIQRQARQRMDELAAEERAVAERLARAEEEDVQRARAVKRQRTLYDAVVDMRIKLEPLISQARTFPTSLQRATCDAWKASEELAEAVAETESALASLSAQTEKAFLTVWPQDDDLDKDVGFTKWRNEILDEWGRKANEAEGVVPKGGFKAIDTSISAQMKASLASGNHLERTRRVSETMPLVGGLELEQGKSEMQYDDGELYRTLLREIIESGEGADSGLRYAQLSKSSRIRKKRDRSLAKGRRLRYDVHEKLIGFLAPVPLPDPGPIDEIVAALFGRRGTVPIRE